MTGSSSREICAAGQRVLQAEGLLGQLLAGASTPASEVAKPTPQLREQLDDAQGKLAALRTPRPAVRAAALGEGEGERARGRKGGHDQQARDPGVRESGRRER